MPRDGKTLSWSLTAGSVYFGCIAFAHSIGLKIPGLFIYFNVPSHPYLDHIIAFLAFGWSAFFYVAAVDPVNCPLPVKAILLSCAIAICGLSGINALGDFSSLAPGANLNAFWVQTALLLCYLAWLYVFYRRSRPLIAESIGQPCTSDASRRTTFIGVAQVLRGQTSRTMASNVLRSCRARGDRRSGTFAPSTPPAAPCPPTNPA